MNTNVYDWSDPANVAAWGSERERGNPQRAEQLGIVLELLATLQPDGHRILDLGNGDGVVDALLLERFPTAYITGVDSSPPMRAAATERLAAYPGRWTLHASPMQGLAAQALPPESFDAAIGIQSIHHLTAAEKQTLFATVAGLLRPGGLFILSDRVALAEPGLFPYYHALWNHSQRQASQPTAPPEYDYSVYRASLAQRGDLPDTVTDQVTWLRAAGFGAADCFSLYLQRAIFGGVKGPAPPPPDTHAALAHTDLVHAL